MSNSFAMSGNNAIYGGSSGVYYSFDSGATWSQSNLLESISGIQLQGQYAVAAAYSYNIGYLYYSNNYGQNWSLASLPLSVIPALYSISLSGNYVVAISLNQNKVYYSSDYGQSYQTSSLPSLALACSAFSNSYALIGGSDENKNSCCWLSPINSDQFGIFTASSTNIGGVMNSIGANNTPYIVAGTNQGLFVSSNSGQNWSTVYSKGVYVNATMSGSNAVAVYANFGTSNTFTVYFNYNYGEVSSWVEGDSLSNIGANVVNAVALSGQNLLVATSSGLYYSSNLGINLSAVSSFGSQNVYSCSLLNSNALASEVTSGTGTTVSLYYSTNSGNTFSPCSYSTTSNQQGAMTVTYSSSTNEKSMNNTNNITASFTATSTASATAETYDKALEIAARDGLRTLVEVLYKTARSYSSNPINGSTVVASTKQPSHSA